MIHVVAHLIFFLIAQNRKCRDRRNKLIVAERFEPRRGGCRGTERKGEGKAKIGIARLREVDEACSKNKRSNPGGAEGVLIAQSQIQIVVVRGDSCGGKRGLLYERIVSRVTIGSRAKEPMRRTR